MYTPPELSQEINNIHRPIPNEEIEIVKSFTTKSGLDPDRFTGEFYQTLKEGPEPILLKLFKNQYQKEDFQTSLVKSVSLQQQIQINAQQQQKLNLQDPLKFSIKYLQTELRDILKRSSITTKLKLSLRCRDGLTHKCQ